MANQRRVFKLGERIQGIIALELLRVADPRFTLVTISSVVVSPDMRNAKIYWVVSGDQERREEVEEAFEGARGLFRKAIARELDIRFIPNLKFFYDDTLDVAAHVDKLFSRIDGGSGSESSEGDTNHEDEPITR
jgi:ribosome-binding factor A